MSGASWRYFAQLQDPALLAHCERQDYKGSGKGGQKRNKTSNGVRLRLQELQVTEEGSRSREANQRHALVKLRLALACELWQGRELRKVEQDPLPLLRTCLQGGRLRVSEKNPLFPLVVGCLFDGIILFTGVAGLAKALDCSKTQLERFFFRHPFLLSSYRRLKEKDALYLKAGDEPPRGLGE